jgi:hypothetical protein
MLRKTLGNGTRVLSRAAVNPLQQTARGLAVPAINRKTKNMFAEMKGMFDFSAPAKIPPMTEPMTGVNLPAEPVYPKTPPATEITTLANGVRVASENTPVRTAAIDPLFLSVFFFGHLLESYSAQNLLKTNSDLNLR